MLANPKHEIAFQELVALLRRQAVEHQISAVQMLAVAANMLGKLVAMQDGRTMSPQRAMKIVADNIEIGNAQALEQLHRTEGTG